MARYTLYFLNDAGRSFRSLELDCADDLGAVLEAEALAAGRATALWEGARVVETRSALRRT
jgi:hypothetical protein